jgi:hypothetical protein
VNIARIKRVVYSAVMGFIVFGTWAYAVNFHYPARRLTSALSQGMFSLTFSLVILSITEATFGWLAGKRCQVPVSIALPVATSVSCAAMIHLAAHTPSNALTLLGPALVGTAYQTAYVMNLRRHSRTH